MKDTPMRHPLQTILTLLISAFLLTGCPHLEPVESQREAFETWNEAQSGYRFLPGDELDIKLLYNPEFSDRVIVAPNGKIYLDLVGAVDVLEKRPEEVAEEVQRLFSRDLKHPEVTVSPRQFGSQVIYVAGEVVKPGMMKLAYGMSVLQGVLEAGGLLDTANLDEIILLRRTPKNTAMLRTVKLREILEGKGAKEDVRLQRFDIVFVPRSDIAQADLHASQYVDKLIPVQRSAFVGYYPGLK